MFPHPKSFSRNASGFTIVELVIVLTCLAILGAIAYTVTKWSRDRAFLTKYLADARQIKLAAERFQQDSGVFPPDVASDVDPGLTDKEGWRSGGHSGKWEALDLSGWKGPYMREWPKNPWGGTYEWDNMDPGDNSTGLPGGAIYLVLKPGVGANRGMPKLDYEHELERQGVDVCPWPNCIAVRLGSSS
jgi:prepilin-type N-terminal cleavage/methylation domain-containing protein